MDHQPGSGCTRNVSTEVNTNFVESLICSEEDQTGARYVSIRKRKAHRDKLFFDQKNVETMFEV